MSNHAAILVPPNLCSYLRTFVFVVLEEHAFKGLTGLKVPRNLQTGHHVLRAHYSCSLKLVVSGGTPGGLPKVAGAPTMISL